MKKLFLILLCLPIFACGPAPPHETTTQKFTWHGGGAFPGGSQYGFSGGITVRDYFASHALIGLLDDEDDMTPQEKVRSAYEYADQMLKERAQ